MHRFEQSRLDDFEIAGPLGSGATARVFEATHVATARKCAIKLLDTSARGNRELRERLAREAVLLGAVQSPHVSRLLGFGWEDDQPFLVLERLEGETLGDVLKREGRLDVPRLVEWVEQLLIGLRDCHNANVIHRDVKPSNIFLAATGPAEPPTRPGAGRSEQPVVKLIDFGVARLNEIAKAGVSLTSTHHLIGSMGYMAPEQLEYAKGVAPSADLYAVGVVIFRALSGRLPFVGRSFEALTKLKCESTAPRLSTLGGVPKHELLDEFVAKALARDPEHRFSSAGEMLQEWWRVAAALDREPVEPFDPPSGHEVIFEDPDPSNTLVDPDGAPAATESGPTGPLVAATASTTLVEGDLPTDPNILAPFAQARLNDTGSNSVPVLVLAEETEEPTKKKAYPHDR